MFFFNVFFLRSMCKFWIHNPSLILLGHPIDIDLAWRITKPNPTHLTYQLTIWVTGVWRAHYKLASKYIRGRDLVDRNPIKLEYFQINRLKWEDRFMGQTSRILFFYLRTLCFCWGSSFLKFLSFEPIFSYFFFLNSGFEAELS